jgi:hypothetical protein
MNKSNHSKILTEIFDNLDAAIVRDAASGKATAISRKDVDCTGDAFGGVKCG